MHCYYHRSQLALASCKCGKRLCLDCTNQAMEDLGICSDCKNELMMFAYLQFKEQALSIPTDQVKLKIEKEFLRCLMHPESPIGRMCSQCNRCYCQDCIHLKNEPCTFCSLERTTSYSYPTVPSLSSQAKFGRFRNFVSDFSFSISQYFEDINYYFRNLSISDTITELFNSFKDMLIGDHKREYYRGSQGLFTFYSFIRFLCFLITLLSIYLEKDNLTFSQLLHILMKTATPIAIFGIVDMLYQLRRKNGRIRLIFEILFYYVLYSFTLEHIKEHHEAINLIDFFIYFYVYLSPLLAIITEVHMWRARKSYYSLRRKQSRWKHFRK